MHRSHALTKGQEPTLPLPLFVAVCDKVKAGLEVSAILLCLPLTELTQQGSVLESADLMPVLLLAWFSHYLIKLSSRHHLRLISGTGLPKTILNVIKAQQVELLTAKMRT